MLLTHLVLLGGAALFGRLLFEKPEAPDGREANPAPAGDGSDASESGGSDAEEGERSEAERGARGEAEEGERKMVDRSLAVSALGGVASALGATVIPGVNLVAVGSILYSSVGMVGEAYDGFVEEGKPNMAALDVCALSIGLYAHLFVLSSAALVLYYGSRKLNLATRSRVHSELSDVFAEYPEEVWLLKDGVEVRVPLVELRPDDMISVHAGEVIPVDGRVIRGAGGVDEQALTGEALPAEKGPDDPVFATTLLLSGRLEIRVVEAGAQTQAQRIEEVLRQTASFENRLVERSERLADATASPTVGVGAVAWLGLGTSAGLGVLMGNYMGTLRLAAPLSMYGTLRQAARHGLFVKDGRSLQYLAELDTIVFDKTGTLTVGGFTLEHVYATSGSSDHALMLAAAAEARQSHPIAMALLAEAAERELAIPPVEEAHTHLGNGVQARFCGEDLWVGSARFLAAAGVAIPADINAVAAVAEGRGHSVVYLAVGGELRALFELVPVVRDGAKELVASLRRRGLDVFVLSGDRASPTRILAEELGAVGHFAEVLPCEKAAVIARLRAEGRRVCFVGDGLNDALALREADLSISLAGASSLAINNAQIILMGEDLRAIEALLGLGDTFAWDQRLAQVAVAGPSMIAIGGVFLAGFSLPTIATLYLASASLGTTVGLMPMLRGALGGDPREQAS